jgi:two-component system sensor histidine kinase PrrB
VSVGGLRWRIITASPQTGVFVDVGARYQLSARAASLRRSVIWTVLIGLIAAAVATAVVTRVSLRPLDALRRKAAMIKKSGDASLRVREPRQPTEVAALADELDAMLVQLARAAAEREAALGAARRFASDVGHELRTPLQSVRSNIEIARHDSIDQAQLEVALAAAASESERLHRLVDGLQSLARGEAGLQSSVGEVDLGDIVDGAVFVARVRHSELQIEVDAPAAGPTVVGDEDGLWRAVENLIENAARHGRPAGHIRITVEPRGSGAAITIEDDGPGIPVDLREVVTSRFVRGTSTTVPGSGLGLAIVQAEAKRHHGSLVLGDSPLGGLRAVVTVGQGVPSLAVL